ncbi:MAG: AMP-binding protein, partial [Pseudomonadales bacterium]|nr:AMP-binding protein [Pseudomonadales bacterium]
MSDLKASYQAAVGQLTSQAGSPFEIGTRELNGVSFKAFINGPSDIPTLVAPARKFGDQEFLIYQDERWSFADYFEQVDRLSHLLREKYGAKKGMRIAIAMRNYPEWMTCWLAIVATGAVVVPINSMGSAEELQFNLEDSEAKLVFCDQRRYDLLNQIGSSLRAVLVRPERQNLTDGHTTLEALLEEAPAASTLPAMQQTIAPDDIA